MALKELPAHPSLEQYKKQAKDLVKSRTSGDLEALRRIREHHPRPDNLSDSESRGVRFALTDAQWIIAREHGFESWPEFARHIRTLTGDRSSEAVWNVAQRAVIAGDVATLERLLRENERLFRQERPPSYSTDPGSLAPDYSGAGARSIIVSNHRFESWTEFAQYLDALKDSRSSVAQFEAAADAIIIGDLSTLERLLQEHPDLIGARSSRKHRATLLHYVAANGVEDFRQRTPENAVKVAELLLRAGAEVDAVADMYGGGSTTLGLVATSIHPLLAGVQDALVATLLDAGAFIRGPGAVNDSLANGRPQAAEFLASRGAPLDLEGAAGVGHLDLVRTFFTADGSLKATATRAQMTDGFAWACEYGRTGVVDFLLQRGIEVSAKLRHHGQTGLHWAASGAHVETVRLLLSRRAPVDAKDDHFEGTPLEWALHGWREPTPGARRDRYYEVVALLVAAGATIRPEWLMESDRGSPLSEEVRADSRMLAALGGVLSKGGPE